MLRHKWSGSGASTSRPGTPGRTGRLATAASAATASSVIPSATVLPGRWIRPSVQSSKKSPGRSSAVRTVRSEPVPSGPVPVASRNLTPPVAPIVSDGGLPQVTCLTAPSAGLSWTRTMVAASSSGVRCAYASARSSAAARPGRTASWSPSTARILPIAATALTPHPATSPTARATVPSVSGIASNQPPPAASLSLAAWYLAAILARGSTGKDDGSSARCSSAMIVGTARKRYCEAVAWRRSSGRPGACSLIGDHPQFARRSSRSPAAPGSSFVPRDQARRLPRLRGIMRRQRPVPAAAARTCQP